MIKAILGSCGFWMTWISNEAIKLLMMIFIAWANVSSFIQMAISYDLRLMSKLPSFQLLEPLQHQKSHSITLSATLLSLNPISPRVAHIQRKSHS